MSLLPPLFKSRLCKSLMLSFLGGAILSGCMSMPYPSPQPRLADEARNQALAAPVPEGKGTLFVAFSGVNEYLNQVRIDGQLVAKVDYGAVRLDLFPGEYSISGGYARHNDRDVNYPPVTFRIEAGKQYFQVFGSVRQGGKTRTKVYTLDGGMTALKRMPLMEPALDVSALVPASTRKLGDECLAERETKVCESVKAEPAYVNLKPSERQAVESILAENARRRAEMQAMEESLPPALRRDKYMLQLTRLLKDKEYLGSLPVFDKLASLGMPLDPSFDYFRGEAYLRVDRKTEALKYLYDYVRNQGPAAKYYKQALELINEAEAG